MAGPAWTMTLLFMLPVVAEMTGMHHHAQYWLRWSLVNFLPGLASNSNASNFSLPSS
jgi:hypothetical protein